MTGPITAGDTSIPKTRQPQAGLQPRDAGQRLGGLGWPRAGKDRPNAGRRLAGFLPGCGVHGGAQGAPREAASRTLTWDLRAAESAAASCVWGSPATAGDATNPSAPLPPCTPGHRADGRPPAGGVYRQDRHLLGRERRQLRHQRGLGASQVQLQAVPGNPAHAAAPRPSPIPLPSVHPCCRPAERPGCGPAVPHASWAGRVWWCLPAITVSDPGLTCTPQRGWPGWGSGGWRPSCTFATVGRVSAGPCVRLWWPQTRQLCARGTWCGAVRAGGWRSAGWGAERPRGCPSGGQVGGRPPPAPLRTPHLEASLSVQPGHLSARRGLGSWGPGGCW